MAEYGGEKRQEVSWNIAADQARFVSELLKNAINQYLEGNLGEWFKYLTALREVCNHELKKGEKIKLNSQEKKLWPLHNYWIKYQSIKNLGKVPSIELTRKKIEFSNETRLYQRRVFKYLKKLGYFPNKEDRTKLSF